MVLLVHKNLFFAIFKQEYPTIQVAQSPIIFMFAGFSINQFEGGNMVVLVSRSGSANITCDVDRYSSSSERIQCVTR